MSDFKEFKAWVEEDKRPIFRIISFKDVYLYTKDENGTMEVILSEDLRLSNCKKILKEYVEVYFNADIIFTDYISDIDEPTYIIYDGIEKVMSLK